MKVLHVVFSLETGGAETMLIDIVNEQVKQIKVELLIINNAIHADLIQTLGNEITIHYLNRTPGSLNPLKIFQFNYLILKIRPDIIHFHHHNAIGLLKVKVKASTCLTIHDINEPLTNFYKYDRLFSISEAVKKDISSRGGGKSIRIYNGINFTAIAQKREYKNSGAFKIVQVSRLHHEKKGQHVLLKALHLLIRKHGQTNIKLDFIGEGASLTYLQELTKELNLREHVEFLGIRNRNFIYKHLKNYNLLVQPSIYEGFGLTVVEGIAAGLPVVVSDIDGPAEIISDLPGARVFESENDESLANAIREVMELYEKEELEARCKKSYSIAAEKFSIPQTASDYIRHYSDCI